MVRLALWTGGPVGRTSWWSSWNFSLLVKLLWASNSGHVELGWSCSLIVSETLQACSLTRGSPLTVLTSVTLNACLYASVNHCCNLAVYQFTKLSRVNLCLCYDVDVLSVR